MEGLGCTATSFSFSFYLDIMIIEPEFHVPRFHGTWKTRSTLR